MTEFRESWIPEDGGFLIQSMVHEMRQPLSAIEAIAYYLEMTVPADQVETRTLLLRLHDLVQESNAILVQALEAAAQTTPLRALAAKA